MLVATAYTSLLFLVPASLLRNKLASFLFWAVTPVSYHTLFHMAVVHGTLWAAMCGA